MYLYYFVFSGLVLFCILVSGCSMLVKDPVTTLNRIAVTSVSFREIGLNVTLNVDNTNPIGITLKSLVFDVYYQKGNDWVYIGHGSGTGMEIKPGMNQVTIPVSVKTAELPGAGLGSLMQREITLQVRGNATPDFFLLSPQIPFSQTVTIPVGPQGT
jgi:LEA14-like dessication related protein